MSEHIPAVLSHPVCSHCTTILENEYSHTPVSGRPGLKPGVCMTRKLLLFAMALLCLPRVTHTRAPVALPSRMKTGRQQQTFHLLATLRAGSRAVGGTPPVGGKHAGRQGALSQPPAPCTGTVAMWMPVPPTSAQKNRANRKTVKN